MANGGSGNVRYPLLFWLQLQY